jgi:hypothetical protein
MPDSVTNYIFMLSMIQRRVSYVSLITGLSLMVICSLNSPVFAARPYHTDDPGTTELGKFEAELCVDYWKSAETPGFVFKHSLTDRMEIDLPINYHILPGRERGVSPLQIYLKFALVPDCFAATVTGSLGDPSYAANLIYGRTIGFFTITGNLGSSMVGNTNDIDMTFGSSGTFTFGRFETGVEITGTQEGLDWWQMGTRFFCTEWFSLDAGIGGDFEKNMGMNMTTGLWFAFPVSSNEKKGQ